MKQRHGFRALSFIRNRLYGKKVSGTLAEFASDPAIQWQVRREVYFLLRSSFGTMDQKLAALEARQAGPENMGEIDPQVIQACIDAEENPAPLELEDDQIESMRLLQEAKRLAEEHAYAKAEELLSRAMELWPQTAGPLMARARVRERLGRLDEALADCSAAISLLPNVAHYYRYRAGLYRQLGLPAQAQADVARADSLETLSDTQP